MNFSFDSAGLDSQAAVVNFPAGLEALGSVKSWLLALAVGFVMVRLNWEADMVFKVRLTTALGGAFAHVAGNNRVLVPRLSRGQDGRPRVMG